MNTKDCPLRSVLFEQIGQRDRNSARILRKAIRCLLIVGFVVASACQPGGTRESGNGGCSAEQVKLIRQAGEHLQIPVRTERMAHFAQAGSSWFAAAAANLETTPATELPKGVDIGVGYFDLPGQKFPKGFYKLRAVADVKEVGRLDGRGQLINDKGEIVIEFPAKVEVKSLTVPERAASRFTPVSLCTGTACGLGGGTPPIAGFWACYDCWNGFTVCFHFSFIDNSFWD